MADLIHSLASNTNVEDTIPCSVEQKDHLEIINPRDRDSGVFLEDEETTSVPPTPQTPMNNMSPSITLTRTRTDSFKSTSGTPTTDASPRRLRRPAELNLSTPSAERPKSELELRFDLIRSSKTQSRAALKSPTQLLKDRLKLSPTKEKGEKIRNFTPPRPMLNGCILPAPQDQLTPFSGTSVRARTEGKGRPAWWCKVDRLVVFDGVEARENEAELKFLTRSSKGLSIARRMGDTETVVIPLDCGHCRDMLNRTEWKYDVQICKRSVCWDCGERCRWEMEEEERQKREGGDKVAEDASRERADSVLQDEEAMLDEVLMAKVGIETGAMSPIEAVGGIEERLERRAEVKLSLDE